MEGVCNHIRKLLQTQRDRCKRKADLLQQELSALGEAAQYRLHAELLLAHQHEVQKGQTGVTLQNYFESKNQEHAPTLTFSIDPRFDAIGNANRLFNKYHKCARRCSASPQIEQVKPIGHRVNNSGRSHAGRYPARSRPGQSRGPDCWLYARRSKITREENSENTQEGQKRQTNHSQICATGRRDAAAPSRP